MAEALVTGASGFIGSHLCQELLGRGWRVRGTVRRLEAAADLPPGVQPVLIPDLGPCTNWRPALKGVDAVVHLAAKVHDQSRPAASADSYQKVNVAGTRSLAEAAAEAGVRRLILASSVKAMAEETPEDQPLREGSPCLPVDPYGISKLQAERALWTVCQASALEGTVFRLPLVYGPGVRANMLRLIQAVERGIPLPLALVSNRRSLLFVGNLSDALAKAVTRPAAAGQTLLVSDNQDLSTPDLVRHIGQALGRPPTLVPVPLCLLKAAGVAADAACQLAGRDPGQVSAALHRLLGSLVVDPRLCRITLDWEPPFSVPEGIRAMVEWYRGSLAHVA
ncbi:MAG: NAD-dependent epimerase/dehydratase family protein [Thermodesulfobacteriota bacterium]